MIAMAEIEAESAFQPGERITHHEYGQGVVLDPVRGGYLRAFFGVGERRVPIASLQRQLSRTERILRAVAGGADRGRTAWLSCEAHALPVVESASALTSARISDVSSSLDRLVRFLCAAVMQRQQKLLKVDEQTYELMTAHRARPTHLTRHPQSSGPISLRCGHAPPAEAAQGGRADLRPHAGRWRTPCALHPEPRQR